MAGTSKYDLAIRKMEIAWELTKESLSQMGYWGDDGENTDSDLMTEVERLLPDAWELVNDTIPNPETPNRPAGLPKTG